MSKDNNKDQSKTSSAQDPVAFMRSRRPDEYTDSKITSSVELTQGLLEYHLETITNRSQETEFAYFARRLAEKEICPNLRPQTGPTGGGDSKADSETIPVSTELSELWVGVDPAAANERWAFAFSAKKDWKTKVRSDVLNIESTKRGYTRIYFITNQFAPDKSRAESEDTLLKETGIRVVILDRSWITKAVIENGRANIAIEALKIEELRSLVEKKIGPADFERQQELDELEKAIADPDHYQGARYQQVEDALRAAILARRLGRPRTEIDGLFIRAERLAKEPDSGKQRLRIAYAYAWTVIFWFNDLLLLNVLYDAVEKLALQSDQIEDIELVQNLWMVLLGQVRRKGISAADAKIGTRKDALTAVLKKLAGEETRPNNALQAKTSLALLAIPDALNDKNPDALKEIWKTFAQIVIDAERLGDYPFERLAKLIEELNDLGADDEEFDTLFETVIATLEKRRGDAAGATMLRDRGMKKLEANKPYEAIGLLGRAMERFVKREHRDDLIFCLMALSDAYIRAHLFWAARCCALSATERCLAYFREDGHLIRFTLSCVEQLVMTELRLGRVSHVLMALELESLLAPQLMLRDERLDRFNKHRTLADGMLGILILASSLEQLAGMARLPEVLEEQGLFMTKAFLLYALGYRDELHNEGFPKDDWSDDAIDDFIRMAFGQPGRLQMPDRPQIEVGSSIIYRTKVLGCQIILEAPAHADAISAAEAVLGTIEAFFATSLGERITPYRSAAKIVVEPISDLSEGLRITQENNDGDSFMRVQYPVSTPSSTPETRQKYRDSLMELVPQFIFHVAVVDDFESYLNRIAGEERGFARALLYAEVSLAQDNVFGLTPKVLIRDWKPPKDARQFPLSRTTEWREGVTITQLPLQQESKPERGDPSDLRAFFRKKTESETHAERKIISHIDIPLWDAAKWRAVFYAADPFRTRFPILCLGFADKEAATKIFQGWKKLFGTHDKDNKIRITILKGIQRTYPSAYRVFVGNNFKPEANSGSLVMMVGRHQTMTPSTTENLDRFLKDLDETRSYYLLAPAHFVSETEVPHIEWGLAIQKDQLIVRQAWEVGPNDIDAPAILAEDDPVIPTDVPNPPVKELLELIRTFGKKRP